MAIFDFLKRDKSPRLSLMAQSPEFYEMLRGKGEARISVTQAMENTAVFRCVSLISYAIAMLPFACHRWGDERKGERATVI